MAPKNKKDAKEPTGGSHAPLTPPRLLERYEQQVLPSLKERLGRANRLSLPRLEKIVINMGVGSAITEKKHMEEAVSALTQIAGQKPVITRSRKSIARRASWSWRA